MCILTVYTCILFLYVLCILLLKLYNFVSNIIVIEGYFWLRSFFIKSIWTVALWFPCHFVSVLQVVPSNFVIGMYQSCQWHIEPGMPYQIRSSAYRAHFHSTCYAEAARSALFPVFLNFTSSGKISTDCLILFHIRCFSLTVRVIFPWKCFVYP